MVEHLQTQRYSAAFLRSRLTLCVSICLSSWPFFSGLMARRDPLGLLSLEAWERRSMEAKAAAEADPELIEARQKLEELQKKTEESNKKERNSQRGIVFPLVLYHAVEYHCLLLV